MFSARRLPDRLHYRLVACRTCGLLRSDPVADPAVHVALYAGSSFDYGDEVANLSHTYGRCLDRLSRWGVTKGSLLDIGCGNGFVLDEALRLGYRTVRGVEPGAAAISQASAAVKRSIICDTMRPSLFEEDTFDVVCMFQVLDHMSDPAAVARECFRVMKPGGLLLCVSHDARAWSARCLGRRSPIVDVEHMFLFSRHTMSLLFERQGFSVVHAGSVMNRYSLSYVLRLVPMPTQLKRSVLRVISRTALKRLRVKVPLGNLIVVGRKPIRGMPGDRRP